MLPSSSTTGANQVELQFACDVELGYALVGIHLAQEGVFVCQSGWRGTRARSRRLESRRISNSAVGFRDFNGIL